MVQKERRERVFELIKSMSKAEKRHFKLYASRLGGDAKFIALFDCLDSLDAYDEYKILARCPDIKKGQLPNIKAHLYRQVLVSLRLLNVKHSVPLRLGEQADFARILFDKGLYVQAEKLLDKVESQAAAEEQHVILLNILELRKQVRAINVSGELPHEAAAAHRRTRQICGEIEDLNDLYGLATRLYALHLEWGYARSQKDLDLLNLYFKPRLDMYAQRGMTITEKLHFYQAMAWYHYVRHNFAYSYRYGRLWLDMFDQRPEMKEIMYDSYLRGYAKIMEGIYLMRKYGLFIEMLSGFEEVCRTTGNINGNAEMISQQVLLTARLNKSILEGCFKEGLWITRSIDGYLKRYVKYLNAYDRMMLDYKVALLYFGEGNYLKCMESLAAIIAVKDPCVRRDLQCYARILNLIASYEAGIDYNMEYQIRSAFTFIVKMKDMTEIKRELFAFLSKMDAMTEPIIRQEFRVLYGRLKPYEHHPYEKRTFYYFDLMSWLESKISGQNFGEIIRFKFAQILKEGKYSV